MDEEENLKNYDIQPNVRISDNNNNNHHNNKNNNKW